MTRYTGAALSVVAVLIAGLGFALSGGSAADSELRRVDCQAITMFTPAHSRSAEDLCANYGGVAEIDTRPANEGLVILVRNQPAGGFEGQRALR